MASRFKALKAGEITVSGTMREWQREQELPRVWVFCGAGESLQTDHLIPKNRGGVDSTGSVA